MQIFRYMIYIWETYEKEEETKKPGISRQKGFRYPPILPIVYYEGRQAWTAPLDFKSRILEGEMFARYIPDFHYHLVPLRNFSRQELLDKQDEISLIMLINKLQSLKDISSFRSLPADRLDAILRSSPDHIVDIIANILRAFLLRSNVPVDETEEVVGKVKEKDMGLLFANMDSIDIPAEQEKIKQERDALQQERDAFQHAQEAFAKEKLELAAEKKVLEDKLKELASK
ncbi:MAG: Rpn family recombination-promoting nuclease/putative transposase [Acetatifactor sp.]|nr:Rpn family recombination-promoting nuclease/putative transposase [Acetatifactor sp.]